MCVSTLTIVPRVFDEEAADAPRFVGQRVDNSQRASEGLGVRGVDCRGFTDVDAEARLRVLQLLGADDDLGRGVLGRWRSSTGSSGDPQPEHVDVEIPRRRDLIPAGVATIRRTAIGGT
jgi:hypothetical protein